MSEHLTLQTDGRGIARVTLNRPDKHNSFDDELILKLTGTFEQLDRDDSVRVVILAAAGKSFSAGADLDWMKRMAGYSEQDNLDDARQLAKMLRTLNELSKPTIARVQGAAFGGAVGLVSCCDMAVGTGKASFCLSEVKLGLVPATISPYVVRAIGSRAARRYFLTAERFDAATAKQLSLLSEVVEDAELDNTIEALCTTLLANGPHAMAISKRLASEAGDQPLSDALIERTSAEIARVRVSPEGQEGLTAFFERRKPGWATSGEES